MTKAGTTVFTSSIWDRLTGPGGQPAGLTAEQLKRAITRDLENLLNTRTAIPDTDLAGLPLCRKSVANFGLADFAQLSLSSSDDQKEVCDRLEAAIVRHEPRLARVRVQLVHQPGSVNRLSLLITGQLRALSHRADNERVRFDVMLEPSSLHYSIR
ncbi:type VI secretion system protein ImpF [Pseudoduganella flava]|uniref:Type VI secretion system baseplate subunit TssE n=1 Tax=Pseudoduganella flava TaxID=871742 RepID=A0A562PK96_9BURK|nr:type VI secretion system baseplate subunit TssE [Pseudoduganella flava]QGZ42218.1 type VI secretion system baseplate subunit TssE [Pseudoduganella flava]TWI44753.1 type VI secretion system protein ImpF [Pseudoduganella flava]